MELFEALDRIVIDAKVEELASCWRQMGMHLAQPIVESCAMFDLIERRYLDGDRLLDQSIKHLPPVCGATPVEAKNELVQIVAQLAFGEASMMDPQKPPFEQ